MRPLIKIAEIIAPHGVKGEVRAIPLTDFPERFYQLKTVMVGAGERYCTEYLPKSEIESVRFHKQFIILKFRGIDCMDAAEGLKRHFLYIYPEERIDLPKGTYYYDQITGLSVVDQEDGYLGVVKEIIHTGSNDVYVVVKHPQQEGEKPKEILVPALKAVVQKVDLVQETMYVDLPKELK